MADKLWIGTDSGNVGDWDTADNWSPSGVPVATDDVIFQNSSQDVLTGLDQSAVALNSVTFDQSYTGRIGTGASDFLQIQCSTCVIGQVRSSTGTQTGSKRLNLDFGTTTACQISVYNTSSSAIDQNRQPLRIRANNASTDLRIYGGSMSVSDDSDNTTVLGDIEVHNTGTVNVGRSVTQTNINLNGGTLNSQSSVTSADVSAGTLNFYDNISASTIGTLTMSGGVVNHFASGTITTINLNGGTLDLTKTQQSKTVTSITKGYCGYNKDNLQNSLFTDLIQTDFGVVIL